MSTPIRSSIIAVILTVAACTPKPETLVPQIQRESEEFLKAITSSNVEETQKRLLSSVCKEISDLVQLVIEKGGSGITEVPSDTEIVEELLKRRNTPFRQNSFVIRSATVGVPSTPQFVNGVFVSFIPARTIARYDDGGNIGKMRLFGPTSITMDSHIVAVSKDKGKTWKFFEADQDPARIDKLIPETAGKLVIPARLIEARQE